MKSLGFRALGFRALGEVLGFGLAFYEDSSTVFVWVWLPGTQAGLRNVVPGFLGFLGTAPFSCCPSKAKRGKDVIVTLAAGAMMRTSSS